MRIVFFEVEEWEKEFLQTHLQEHELSFVKDPLTQSNILEFYDSEILSVMIYSQLRAELLEKIPSLRYITTRSTGFDHIDLEYCKKKNILVSNVPTYGARTVAEHTFALILALSHKIIESVERTRRGDFSLKGLRGVDLCGKTIGVIGLGNIGRAVIDIAYGFGMRVLVNTKTPDLEYAKQHDVAFVSLEELLSQSDVISLHIPYTPQTQHFINKENIQKCKPGSILINTARGGVVETEAILYGLDHAILAGAGLDVLEEECFVKEETQLLTEEFLKECNIKTQLLNHVLLTKPNVIITPHNAFNSKEALQRILDVTVNNIVQFVNHTPQNLVTQ
ncbi:MAG TPA: hydroxyacid dehydrogenase [Patescibacteria group bacterium]|nr:hydroxyacid dehydrogenase [Patescibacteria group bacterium]